MDSKPEKANRPKHIRLGSDTLKTFFVSHLARIYCAKEHLIRYLPQISYLSNFDDLHKAMEETINIVRQQIGRMDRIYEILETNIPREECEGLKGLIEDAFLDIEQQKSDPELLDMSILFYMQNIESVEMASFQVLQIAAVKLKNEEIKNLLKLNFDEAKVDRRLLLLVTAKYVTSKDERP